MVAGLNALGGGTIMLAEMWRSPNTGADGALPGSVKIGIPATNARRPQRFDFGLYSQAFSFPGVLTSWNNFDARKQLSRRGREAQCAPIQVNNRESAPTERIDELHVPRYQEVVAVTTKLRVRLNRQAVVCVNSTQIH